MAWRFWTELTSSDFSARDLRSEIAVLPVAAIEQHGPHLPVGTDTIIAEGMLVTARALIDDALDVIVLPVQTIGKSNEHAKWPGTVTLTAESALKV